jgi:type II secretory pathway component PulK
MEAGAQSRPWKHLSAPNGVAMRSVMILVTVIASVVSGCTGEAQTSSDVVR